MNDDSTTHVETTLELYREFISQVELSRIWLVSARVTNSTKGSAPTSAEVNIESSCKWEVSADGFTVLDKYVIDFANGKKKLGRVEVQFGLEYLSSITLEEDTFALFRDNNLPLNSWPYVREFVASSVSRMQWLPFTLPARRIIPDLASPEPEDEEEH